jgi:hypothetical protein
MCQSYLLIRILYNYILLEHPQIFDVPDVTFSVPEILAYLSHTIMSNAATSWTILCKLGYVSILSSNHNLIKY